MRHMHQVISFVETSPEFSQNDVNNLRQLSRELSLIEDLFRALFRALSVFEDLFRALSVFTPSSYRAPVRYTGAVGRPSYEIYREQIILYVPATFHGPALLTFSVCLDGPYIDGPLI